MAYLQICKDYGLVHSSGKIAIKRTTTIIIVTQFNPVFDFNFEPERSILSLVIDYFLAY